MAKHHHGHGIDASVPAKGSKQAIHAKHWERTYDTTDPSKNMELTEGSDFAPKRARDRKSPHIRVNETDH